MKKHALILFLAGLITHINTAFCMHREIFKAKSSSSSSTRDMVERKNARTPQPKAEVKFVQSARSTTTMSRNTHLDRFVLACTEHDHANIKTIFLEAQFTKHDWAMALSSCPDNIFMTLIDTFFYNHDKELPDIQDVFKDPELSSGIITTLELAVHVKNSSVVERIIKNYTEDNKELALAIRKHLEQAALEGNPEIVECILNSCISLPTPIIDHKYLKKIHTQVINLLKNAPENRQLQLVNQKLEEEALFQDEVNHLT